MRTNFGVKNVTLISILNKYNFFVSNLQSMNESFIMAILLFSSIVLSLRLNQSFHLSIIHPLHLLFIHIINCTVHEVSYFYHHQTVIHCHRNLIYLYCCSIYSVMLCIFLARMLTTGIYFLSLQIKQVSKQIKNFSLSSWLISPKHTNHYSTVEVQIVGILAWRCKWY